MPRIPYLTPEQMSQNVRNAVARAPINVVRMMAGTSEAVFNGFNAFSGAFYGPASSLPAEDREVAILRVGYLSNSKYETFQHEAAAKLAGLNEGQIEAIRHGGEHPGVLNETQQAILNFTDDVVKNVRAGDSTLDSVRKLLSDKQVLDLTLLIGLYMMVSRFLETAGVDLDTAALDWKHLVPQK
ncbi:MAG TPA: carboxymuconolactone decarboxylase family protein [Alphaproteobacteria bacterium]|jgi:alkylhydroperoxidase family enzyme|nr:carboxymuconolactone decarboxylase family protein [Alphaproteobacteria bacterium]